MKTFFVKIMVAAMVATGVLFMLIEQGASSGAAIGSYFLVGIGVSYILGAFRVREESKHESILHYNGRRNYGQAAVFIGTAAIFIGTPQQCEDMADDLLHYGQQARVEMVTGEETIFNVL